MATMDNASSDAEQTSETKQTIYSRVAELPSVSPEPDDMLAVLPTVDESPPSSHASRAIRRSAALTPVPALRSADPVVTLCASPTQSAGREAPAWGSGRVAALRQRFSNELAT